VSGISIELSPHPLLRTAGFTTVFAAELGATSTPLAIRALLALDANAPLSRDEQVRADVRDMLRHGGYKPTGRGKPASEYLVRSATEGSLAPINLAVDACNAVSLHSGLPISVIDLDRASAPFRVDVAPDGSAFVFNASGQEIRLAGLLCLSDAAGPCANAVKDAQRTKTDDSTRSTLSVVWGVVGHEARLAAAASWYRSLLEEAGATTTEVAFVRSA
jgi:DNA/RNA-binding domain of Phe-tRNA-synthetase-like protein